MRKIKLKNWLFIAALTPFLAGCPKPHIQPPEQDTEVQTSIDASFATFVVSDIEMMCSIVGEGNTFPKFYMESPESELGPGNIGRTEVRRDNDDFLSVIFNQTRCLDGRLRSGTVHMYFNNDANQNANYMRDYKFVGQITTSEYKVDGWLVKPVAGKPCMVYNLLPSAQYDPSKTNLSWLIEGSFEFIHPTDPSRNMVWMGKITKTLANTADNTVFPADRQHQINWPLAKVEYKGTVTGVVSENIPFKMVLNDLKPVTRDFTCFPGRIGGITRPGFNSWNLEFHPFSKGIATFTPADKYPRQIYYGNEDDATLEQQCDNVGIVHIKGISHKIDFME